MYTLILQKRYDMNYITKQSITKGIKIMLSRPLTSTSAMTEWLVVDLTPAEKQLEN